MFKSEYVKPISDVIFFCGFKTDKTIHNEDSTVYTLNTSSGQKVSLTLWSTPDKDTALSIEYESADIFDEKESKRFNRVLEKLNSIQGLIVSVEKLSEPVFTEEQEKILDFMCEEI